MHVKEAATRIRRAPLVHHVGPHESFFTPPLSEAFESDLIASLAGTGPGTASST